MGIDGRTDTIMQTQRQTAWWYGKPTFLLFRREIMLRNNLMLDKKFPTYWKFDRQ
jgi:hypothetical protein